MTTPRQKAAVRFVEEVCKIEFKGDINNFNEVSDFLGDYLEDAKMIFDEAQESYYGEFMY